MNPETVVCQLTPPVPAGIATLAVRGPRATEIVTSTFQFPVPGGQRQHLQEMRIYYATWSASAGSTGEEQVVICRTSDQQVEVHCHGGKAICEALMKAMTSLDAKRISVQDWPSSCKSHLSAEAEFALQDASTDLVASVLLDQLNGALDREIDCLEYALKKSANSVPVGQVLDQIDELLDAGQFGRNLKSGWRVVLAGPPNVGKSSLINGLVGQDRLIVHSQPGTTRDWTESGAVVGGWPVQLTDTAGIRESDDAVESAGVAKATELVQSCDLLVIVVDATQGWQPIHEELGSISTRRLVCWNKMDQVEAAPDFQLSLPCTFASCIGKPGIQGLLQNIEKELFADVPLPGAAVPFATEHLLQLRRIRSLVEANQFAEAVTCIRNWRSRG